MIERCDVFAHSTRLCAAALALVAVLAVPAAADSYVDQVNAAYSEVPREKRSDLVLLPVLAEMDAPPERAIFTDPRLLPFPVGGAAFFGPWSRQWSALVQWAEGDAQRAAIDALAQVTDDEDFRTAMVFGLPYGVDSIPVDLVIAEAYVELGDPPLLASAEFFYFDELSRLTALMVVEARRRQEAGDPAAAIEATFDLLYLGRQMADRVLPEEKQFGMLIMRIALLLARDIAYIDSRASSPGLTNVQLAEFAERLEPRRGYASIRRLSFPSGLLPATEQLLYKIFEPMGRPDVSAFGPTLAELSVGQRKLRLFQEAARWNDAARGHANLQDTLAAARRVIGDWETRWAFDLNDTTHKDKTEFAELPADRFAALKGFPGGAVERITPRDRKALATEIAGTRMAFAAYGYVREHNAMPPVLASVRPDYVRRVDLDPYNPGGLTLQYYVPIRDTPGNDPFTLRLFLPAPWPEFETRLGSDTFVLYSVGEDIAAEFAINVVQDQPEFSEGDYLLWPPTLALVRDYLEQTGQLR